MQDNNMETVTTNALSVKKDSLNEDKIKSILTQIKEVIELNQDILETANKVDKKNKNGFIMNPQVIKNLILNLEKETLFYGTVTLSQKENDLLYGKQITIKRKCFI